MLCAKLRNAVLNNVPDELVVHAEVVVNQTVAHTGHGAPLHRWMLCAKLRGNFLRRLSDNLKTSYNRTTQRFVHDEVLELQSRSLGK